MPEGPQTNERPKDVLLVEDNRALAGLLCGLLAARGLACIVAHSARAALDLYHRHQPPIVVLDLLLPGATGHRFIERLRSEDLRLPAVFVITGVFTEASERERLSAAIPISGWFEKPFDTEALVRAVARLRGDGDGRLEEVSAPHEVAEREASEREAAEREAAEREAAEREAAEREAVRGGPAEPVFDLGSADLSSELTSLGLQTNLRSGVVGPSLVPEILYAFFIAKETGEIVFESEHARKVVYFRGGTPVFAISDQDEDRREAIDRRSFGLTTQEIEDALKIAQGTQRMIGDVLAELGLLDASRHMELLREQTRVILRSLFTWVDGHYVVGFNVSSTIDHINLKEHLGALILNGIRDAFSLDRLRSLLPESACPLPSPSPPFELAELPLSDAEAWLLVQATGTRSVGRLAFMLRDRLGERQVYAVLYALLLLGVLWVEAP
ncbi:MAG: response regulator [Deltaproteobacteria bacterium]|nr:response regulator [Deltaproteobacteria bacterium]